MSQHNLETRLQQLVKRQVAKRQICNIVVGVESADGRIETAAAAGHANAGGTVAMAADTPYYPASITKMYTATVVMKLARSRISILKLRCPRTSTRS